MAAPEAIEVIIEDTNDSVRVDHETGNIETDTPDGGVVVDFGGAKRQEQESEENEFYRNLADEIDQAQLAAIAGELIDAVTADDTSRQEWLQIRARGLNLLGIKLEEPKSTVGDSSAMTDGISSVTNPLLLDALLRSWANATGEFLPSQGPVKIKDDGDTSQAQDDLAESLERDMNHYLTTTASEYYPDTSHMLLWGTHFGGSGFKKIYRCPIRRRPVSESVDPKDLIVSDTTKDLRSCGRITHQITMRPSVMKRMMHIGAYRTVPLTQPTKTPNVVDDKVAEIQGVAAQRTRPEDQPYTIWETQCELDLSEFAPSEFKEEGIPLPYLVTMDKESREILAIRRDWKEDDDQATRKRMYVRWPYVPGPGFYGTGLLNILGNATSAMTAAWREALDAGMYASFPGGLIAKLGGRQNTSDFRLAPGQFQPIETNGMPINQVAMGLPYRDVTSGLLSLMDKIVAQAKGLGGAAEIPSADGLANVPVGTMLAQIEQATKVMSAAHRGQHTAQAEEFELLIELFRENPQDFWRGNKVCPQNYWTDEKFTQAINNCDLVPVSDPNIPSHIHRVGKALALAQLIMLPPFTPLMEPMETLKRILTAIREDEKGLIIPPPPSAGPSLLEQSQMVKAKASADSNQAKIAAEQIRSQTKLTELGQKSKMEQAKLQGQKDVKTLDLAQALVVHSADQNQTSHDRALDLSKHALDQRGQVLDQQRFQHDRQMDLREAQDRAKEPKE